MIYAVNVMYICLRQVMQYPVARALSLSPQWYFESIVRSHALKTPLTSLSIALSELETVAPQSSRFQRAIKEARAASQKLQTLVLYSNDTRQQVPVLQTLKHVQQWFRSIGCEVHLLIKPNVLRTVYLPGNQLLFEQLIEILLNNGVEADVDQRFVVISVSVVDQWLYIVIQDFGKGMTRRELLASHFRSVRATTSHWGIGLACARRIIAQYHGYLKINSWHSIGTQVICTLPLAHE